MEKRKLLVGKDLLVLALLLLAAAVMGLVVFKKKGIQLH